MKHEYVTPEIEIVKFTLKDVIMNSPTEGTIPDQGGDFNEGGLGDDL